MYRDDMRNNDSGVGLIPNGIYGGSNGQLGAPQNVQRVQPQIFDIRAVLPKSARCGFLAAPGTISLWAVDPVKTYPYWGADQVVEVHQMVFTPRAVNTTMISNKAVHIFDYMMYAGMWGQLWQVNSQSKDARSLLSQVQKKVGELRAKALSVGPNWSDLDVFYLSDATPIWIELPCNWQLAVAVPYQGAPNSFV